MEKEQISAATIMNEMSAAYIEHCTGGRKSLMYLWHKLFKEFEVTMLKSIQKVEKNEP